MEVMEKRRKKKGWDATMIWLSRERGDVQVKVGQQTFPAEWVRIEGHSDESGLIDYVGTLKPDRLEGDERNALNRVVYDGRPFKIITKEEGELRYSCSKGSVSPSEFESNVFTFKAKPL